MEEAMAAAQTSLPVPILLVPTGQGAWWNVECQECTMHLRMHHAMVTERGTSAEVLLGRTDSLHEPLVS